MLSVRGVISTRAGKFPKRQEKADPQGNMSPSDVQDTWQRGNALVKTDNSFEKFEISVFAVYLCWSICIYELFHGDRGLEPEMKQAFVSDRERVSLAQKNSKE